MSKADKVNGASKPTLEETAKLGPLNVDDLEEVDRMIDEGHDDESIAIIMKMRLRRHRKEE